MQEITLGTGLSFSGSVLNGSAGASGANPTATATGAAIDGSASTFMRSDAAPAIGTLNQNTTGTAANLSGSQTQNFVYAAPSGSSGTAGFRALVAGDIPSLSGVYLPLAGGTMAGAIGMAGNTLNFDAYSNIVTDGAQGLTVSTTSGNLTIQPSASYSNIFLGGVDGAAITSISSGALLQLSAGDGTGLLDLVSAHTVFNGAVVSLSLGTGVGGTALKHDGGNVY